MQTSNENHKVFSRCDHRLSSQLSSSKEVKQIRWFGLVKRSFATWSLRHQFPQFTVFDHDNYDQSFFDRQHGKH